MTDMSESELVAAWQPHRVERCEAWLGHGDGEGNPVACGKPTVHVYATDQGPAWLCAEHAPPINEKGQVT